MIAIIPYTVGQKIKLNGETHEIRGIDVYIGTSKRAEYIRVRTDKTGNGYIVLRTKRGTKK